MVRYREGRTSTFHHNACANGLGGKLRLSTRYSVINKVREEGRLKALAREDSESYDGIG